MPQGSNHRPAACGLVPGSHICRGLRGLVLVVGASAPLLGGCAMSFPMGSMLPASDDITGSLSKVPFGSLLNEEDRRREKAALATALDPQGDGTTVRWENQKSGNTGSVTPVGHAYPSDSRICRGFEGTIKRDGVERSLHGTACTVAAGDWEVRDAKPSRKG